MNKISINILSFLTKTSTMVSNPKNSIIIIANGFQTDYMQNLVFGLSEYCKVILICSDDLEQFQFNSNVTIKNFRGDLNTNVSFKTKATRILKYYFKLYFYIITSKAKVIHIQWLKFYLMDGFLFILFAKLTGKKIIYTVHDVIPHDRDIMINRLIFRLIYRSQDVLIAHTKFIKQRLQKEFKISENKVHVIEHGVYNLHKNDEITLQSARKKYNLDKDDFVILFFGWIAKYKGIELIASNINGLNTDKLKVKLIIAGRVAKDYESEFYKYFNGIDSTNIVTRFGFIDDNEVELLFKSSNVTVLPYKEASQSGVLFLSYAYGVPVIAPKLGGFPDYIIHRKTGMLYDPVNDSGFVKTVNESIQIFNNPGVEHRKDIERFAQENYSWTSSCKLLCEIYNKYQ